MGSRLRGVLPSSKEGHNEGGGERVCQWIRGIIGMSASASATVIVEADSHIVGKGSEDYSMIGAAG